jgi:hypothetical protein
MSLSSSDITFTFSGGSTNSNPNESLGGDPSVQPILNKRLFDDVIDAETKSGMIDYRCLYVNNESAVNTLYNATIYIAYTVPGDTTVQLGFSFENERQNLTITNATSITSGSFTLVYTDNNNHDVLVNWNSNLSVWSGNLQTALRAITNLEDIIVSGSLAGSNVVFEIDFVEAASKRYHEVLALKTGGNNLVSSQATTISVVKSVNGGPINRIADVIDVDTTTPNNIVFNTTALVGDIRPLDSIPIWIKRIVPANTSAIENDGFVLRIKGDGVPE